MGDLGPGPRPLVAAHRGLAAGGRENTIASARAALASGADAIEVDVRCTADGVPVLHHDPDLDGLTVARTPLDLHTVRALRLGSELATLADLLDALPVSALLDLEIKHPAATGPALDLVDGERASRTLVTSFRPRVLREVRQRASELATGLMLGRRSAYRLLFSRRRERRLRAWLGDLDPDALVLHRSFLRLGLAATAFAPGLPVVVWTVNGDRALRRTMADPLLAGVITDRPARAHRARSLVQSRDERDAPARTRIDGASNGSQQPG